MKHTYILIAVCRILAIGTQKKDIEKGKVCVAILTYGDAINVDLDKLVSINQI